jgi:toxin ParE1/3/4
LNLPVRVRPRAELDLRLAARWYEARRPGLGALFIDELDRLIGSLPGHGLLYPQRFGGSRRAFARHFPYAVHFLMDSDCVVILRVLHMRRQVPQS